MAGIVAWMAIWWISEAVPLPVTSLLPLVLYPMFGIESVAATAMHYGREIIFLFLGGFILALAIERSGAHKRIALHIISWTGGSPGGAILGIMVACALLSMWINSTATTLVMLPIALSLLDDESSPADVRQRMTIPLLLAVAYGATIGGMSTPVGTPPNLILIEFLRQYHAEGASIGFGEWMAFGLPITLILLLLAWVVLTRMAFNTGKVPLGERKEVRRKLSDLGPLSTHEIRALTIFSVVALLWITGDDLRWGEEWTLHGWRHHTGLVMISDAAVAVAGAMALFLMPAYGSHEGKDALMEWRFAEARVPWGVLLLIGGGFALGAGMDRSGLSTIFGNVLTGIGALPPVLLIGVVVLVVCLLSELGSNTATASLVIPILAGTGASWGLGAEQLLIPATLGASLGFMLPVASPMQTIVFGTGRIPVRQMVKAGLWMDLFGVLVLALYFGL